MTNDESPVVTRSVEIPDETVREALDGYCSVPTYGTYQGQFDAMRAALAAALPYLAPAEPPTLDLEEVLLILAQFDVGGWKYDNPQEFRDRLGAALVKLRAPAGDGGEAARNAAYQEAASDIRREIDLRADLEAEGPDMPPEYWQAFKTCMDIASEVGGLT